MDIKVQKLANGVTILHVDGPCEFCQVDKWPCSEKELDSGFSREASTGFRRDCHALNLEKKAEPPRRAAEWLHRRYAKGSLWTVTVGVGYWRVKRLDLYGDWCGDFKDGGLVALVKQLGFDPEDDRNG